MAAIYSNDEGETTIEVESDAQARVLESLGWELVDGERPEAPAAPGEPVDLEREPFDPAGQGVTGADVADEVRRVLADADAYTEAAHTEVERIVALESSRTNGARKEVRQVLEELQADQQDDDPDANGAGSGDDQS